MKKCKRCGHVNEDDVRFCYSCGNDLNADIKPAPKPPVPLKTLLFSIAALALVAIAAVLLSKGSEREIPHETVPPHFQEAAQETFIPTDDETEEEQETIPVLPVETTPPALAASVMPGTIDKTDYYPIVVSRIDASSELVNGRWNFPAEHAVDGNRKTSWQEYVDGDGVGEYLTVYFDHPVSLSVIEIYAGYHADEAGFKANCRPSSLRLRFSDGRSLDVFLEDRRIAQTIVLNYPVETEYVMLTITGAYEGTKWDDNVITDVSFFS